MVSMFGGMSARASPPPIPVSQMSVQDASTSEATVLGQLLLCSLKLCDTMISTLSILEERDNINIKKASLDPPIFADDSGVMVTEESEEACSHFALQVLLMISDNTEVLEGEVTAHFENFEHSLELLQIICDDLLNSEADDPHHDANMAIIARYGGWLVVIKALTLCLDMSNRFALQSVLELVNDISCVKYFKEHILPQVLEFDSTEVKLAALLQVVDKEHEPHAYEAVIIRGPDVVAFGRLIHLIKKDPIMRTRSLELRRYVHELCDFIAPR